ncbi:hypothetical protein [Candidatus Poriferisocius sp.]|uniref:hypothetical protein n=1 Tax=Candidatus Poriferisocius sp. TaxID=3101276 RepID=UPI003B014E3C
MNEPYLHNSANQSEVGNAGSIGWWRAFALTFAYSFILRDGVPACRPPDDYSSIKHFLVMLPQKYDPFTGKLNLRAYFLLGIFGIPTILISAAVTDSAGFLYGFIAYLALGFVLVVLMAVSSVAYFKAGGGMELLREQDRRKSVRAIQKEDRAVRRSELFAFYKDETRFARHRRARDGPIIADDDVVD